MASLILPENDRETMSATFPDYTGKEGSYDEYVNKCINQMDAIIEHRNSESIIANHIDDWMIDTDSEPDDDTLTSYNPNTHTNDEIGNKLTSQNPSAKSTSYYEHLRKEAQEASDRACHAIQIQTGNALRNFSDSFGGLDKMHMSMDQVLDTIAKANTRQALFSPSSSKATTRPGYVIENGRYVRTFSPSFSVCPNGNQYMKAFMYWSQYPMTPQYNQVKELFAAEEMKAVEHAKSFYRLCGKPNGKSDEEWEHELDILYNPYTKYGQEVSAPKSNDPNQPAPLTNDDIYAINGIKCSVKLEITDEDGNTKEYDKSINEKFTYDGIWYSQDFDTKTKIDTIKYISEHKNPSILFREYLKSQQSTMDKACPGWETKSAQEFFSPKTEFAANYYQKTYDEPHKRLVAYEKKYQERYGVPEVLPMDVYLKNVGLQRLNDIATNQTEGDLIVQKLGLTPGTPGFDMAMQKRADEIKWCQENINPDGSYNIDNLKEKYPNWDAMRKAHKLSILYTDHKATIADNNSMMKLPLSIESTLTVEEKQACGILPEAPDYNAMKEYAESNGKTILEAFDLRHSPFKSRFNEDGTLKSGGFGQPGFEKKQSKYKTIKDCPDYFERKEDIPEEFLKDFAYSHQDKRWINLDRI